MPYIQIDGSQHPLRVGETPVGTSADAVIRVRGAESLGVQAVLVQGQDKSVSIRRASPAAVVKVNGIQLGAEPSPLIHGDKVEIAGHEMLFGDEKKGGGTQMLSGLSIPELTGEASASAPARPTAATGGRLVSLVDGREYAIPREGLSLGRDAGCDVVIPGSDVSRRHAEIAAGAEGYVVTDNSTNGVLINGERVRKSQLLGRGDVLRIGSEEFRFYADVPAPSMPTPVAPVPKIDERAAPPPPAAPRPPAGPSAPVPPSSVAPSAVKPSSVEKSAASPGAAPTPSAASPGTPASSPSQAKAPPPRQPADRAPGASPPPAAARPPADAAPSTAGTPTPRHVPQTAEGAPAARAVLATLEVTGEGVHKGKRFELRLPLIHVGRGAHNDVALAEDSVSDTHAKLQKRDDGWFVVDMGSTNGTYVAGRRISGEQRLEAECDLRFGGIRMRFRTVADAVEEARGTRAIAGVSVAEARRAAEAARQPAPEAAEPPPRGVPGYVWLIALALLVLAVYFILQGQGR